MLSEGSKNDKEEINPVAQVAGFSVFYNFVSARNGYKCL